MKRFWKDGDPWIWLTGGALAICLLMVVALIGLVAVNGFGFFWPQDVEQFTLTDGTTLLGQVVEREIIPGSKVHRIHIRQGNRDLYGIDFIWVDEAKISKREKPAEAIVLERREWGNFYGYLGEVRESGKVVARGPVECWDLLQKRIPEAKAIAGQILAIEKDEIGENSHQQDKIRLKLKSLQPGPEVDRLKGEQAALQAKFEGYQKRLVEIRSTLTTSVLLKAAGDKEKDLPIEQFSRLYRPNGMGLFAKLGHYVSKFWEFIWEDPRESNTEGGVFPAIFGTVMMVMIMSIFVTPLGILAALYLREYAKQGPFVSTVRIAVNNLAGVPSIVFGVFGVGFFIYFLGGSIDRLFFPESLPNPTFGTGGILWASLTLALLTVPVVIVAAEEGLAAIPKGLREASLALGATKFETTWRVVLPALMPSILTGLILAMARAAGEVAPLMITGVVKMAPALPVDGYAPYLHMDRKFMHLGFHIYDVGFQSPNVDAARPMVFATTFLLLTIVVLLNLTAIVLRKRLSKKLSMAAL